MNCAAVGHFKKGSFSGTGELISTKQSSRVFRMNSLSESWNCPMKTTSCLLSWVSSVKSFLIAIFTSSGPHSSSGISPNQGPAQRKVATTPA